MTDIKDQAIVFQCDYVDRPAGSENLTHHPSPDTQHLTPDFQDIHISRVTCRGTHTGIKASGIPGMDCVHDIDISDVTIVYNNTDQQIDDKTAKLKLTNVKLVKH